MPWILYGLDGFSRVIVTVRAFYCEIGCGRWQTLFEINARFKTRNVGAKRKREKIVPALIFGITNKRRKKKIKTILKYNYLKFSILAYNLIGNKRRQRTQTILFARTVLLLYEEYLFPPCLARNSSFDIKFNTQNEMYKVYTNIGSWPISGLNVLFCNSDRNNQRTVKRSKYER